MAAPAVPPYLYNHPHAHISCRYLNQSAERGHA
jgi:hypothetical protein